MKANAIRTLCIAHALALLILIACASVEPPDARIPATSAKQQDGIIQDTTPTPEPGGADAEAGSWQVRMIYPCGADSGSAGHYDLQLAGNYTIDGIEYTDPVFSYGREGSTGFLALFDGDISAAVYKESLPFREYSYHSRIAATDARRRAFLNFVMAFVEPDSRSAVEVTDNRGQAAGRYYRYAVTSCYRKYDRDTHNCFKAVGLWMSALGDDRFTEFAESHLYTDYFASPMLEDHSSLWELAGTYA